VEKIITPEGFGKNYAGHDIALLRLSRDVQYSAAVGKICLPDNPPPDRANCVAIGWGDTQGQHSVICDVLDTVAGDSYSCTACLYPVLSACSAVGHVA